MRTQSCPDCDTVVSDQFRLIRQLLPKHPETWELGEDGVIYAGNREVANPCEQNDAELIIELRNAVPQILAMHEHLKAAFEYAGRLQTESRNVHLYAVGNVIQKILTI